MIHKLKKSKSATLEHALAIAAEAHEGQRDKAGEIYIFHPLRLMMKVEGVDAKTVAILHDVIEDTDWTIERLRAEGFSEKILAALICLTRIKGEDYFKMINRVLKNRIARIVKLADLEDNMNVLRMKTFGSDDGERIVKYHKARRMILGEAG